MTNSFSISTLSAMMSNLWCGLFVLATELRWTFGKGLLLWRHIRLIKSRLKKSYNADECELLTHDLAVLEATYEREHKAYLAPLAKRFPALFA